MEVFVVTQHDYEQTCDVGVYSTESKAVAAIKNWEALEPGCYSFQSFTLDV
ncbi:hypothetical protein SEA_ABBYDAISY_30 [Arthrobacter phage AbbyDaisy]|nr:hypothetical protein SEA_ABBYDAISY_30 [Arthrobacter phage AbbyDaisy]